MRFVTQSNLKEGMVVAKDLVDSNHQFLLKKGFVLTKEIIPKIKNFSFQGLLIEDDLSEGALKTDRLCENIRVRAVKVLKKQFENCDFLEKDNDFNRKWEEIRVVVHDIVSDVIKNDVTVISLTEIFNLQNYLYEHSVNVCVLSVILGIALGYEGESLVDLGLSAIMHDVGKVFIDKRILNKKGSLTQYEYDKIRCHSDFGFRFLKNRSKVKSIIARGVLDHHERYDGKGYPNKRKGNGITEVGRIICICDVYEALVSHRPYKKGVLPAEALEYIMGNGGRYFDMEIVKQFVNCINTYAIGSIVKLSNDYTAIVLDNNNGQKLRPKVKIIYDQNGDKVDQIWNLEKDGHTRNVTIIGFEEEVT